LEGSYNIGLDLGFPSSLSGLKINLMMYAKVGSHNRCTTSFYILLFAELATPYDFTKLVQNNIIAWKVSIVPNLGGS
jgi:hypothetical protein